MHFQMQFFLSVVSHEFLSASTEDIASTNGFIAVLLSKLMQFDGAAIWISASRTLFPPALKSIWYSTA